MKDGPAGDGAGSIPGEVVLTEVGSADVTEDVVVPISANDDVPPDAFRLSLQKRASLERRSVITKDKLIFTVGIVNCFLLCACTASDRAHFLLPYLYTVKFFPLLLWRFWTYRKQKYHLFMLDFCYWVNLALFLYLWVFPNQPKLFVAVHALSHGPLAIAVVTFRNALVFHSADKMTSCFIHISPLLLTMTLRHHAGDINPYWYRNFEVCMGRWVEVDGGCQANWSALWIYCYCIPLAAYVGWMVAYGFICNVLPCTAVWRNDKEYLTLYRWTTGRPGALLYSAVRLVRDTETARVLTYAFINVLFTSLCLLPVILFYHSEVASIIFISGCVIGATYNGASFYFQVFARKYFEDITKAIESKHMQERDLGAPAPQELAEST